MVQPDGGEGRSLFVTTRDGLRLHARVHEAPGSMARPVLCLAGLTRNSRDFTVLAKALASGDEARTVYALDARGRGLSERDPDWKNYNVPTETQDVVDFAAAVGLHGAHVVGTSRGGLVAMVLAAVQPAVIGSVVLNDIGPVIELDGLTRIAGYVGRVPVPVTWKEAAETVAALNRRSFPAVPEARWEEVARAWFNENNGKPTLGYDQALSHTVSVSSAKVPDLWPQFTALGRVPMLAIRGENTDILSAETFAEMQRRHPACASLVVPGEGHAPLLMDDRSVGAIKRFLAAADRNERIGRRDLASGRV
ncbi:MAG: alpha/beta fold hydrolase [Hyphomicrobiaceae bacterium]